MTETQKKYLEYIKAIIDEFGILKEIPFRIHLANLVSKFKIEEIEEFSFAFNFLIFQYSELDNNEIEEKTKNSLSKLLNLVKNN